MKSVAQKLTTYFFFSLEVPPLRGSGSDFGIPVYNDWFNTLYVSENIDVSYQERNVNEALQSLQNSTNSFTFAG